MQVDNLTCIAEPLFIIYVLQEHLYFNFCLMMEYIHVVCVCAFAPHSFAIFSGSSFETYIINNNNNKNKQLISSLNKELAYQKVVHQNLGWSLPCGLNLLYLN